MSHKIPSVVKSDRKLEDVFETNGVIHCEQTMARLHNNCSRGTFFCPPFLPGWRYNMKARNQLRGMQYFSNTANFTCINHHFFLHFLHWLDKVKEQLCIFTLEWFIA